MRSLHSTESCRDDYRSWKKPEVAKLHASSRELLREFFLTAGWTLVNVALRAQELVVTQRESRS
jgi:hypothetical protein